jgi:hypothetical protein
MAVAAYTFDKLPPAEQQVLPNEGHIARVTGLLRPGVFAVGGCFGAGFKDQGYGELYAVVAVLARSVVHGHPTALGFSVGEQVSVTVEPGLGNIVPSGTFLRVAGGLQRASRGMASQGQRPSGPQARGQALRPASSGQRGEAGTAAGPAGDRLRGSGPLPRNY